MLISSFALAHVFYPGRFAPKPNRRPTLIKRLSALLRSLFL